MDRYCDICKRSIWWLYHKHDVQPDTTTKTQLQQDISDVIDEHYAPINGSEDLKRAIFKKIGGK